MRQSIRRRFRPTATVRVAASVACAVVFPAVTARAGQFSVTRTADTTVDSRALTLDSSVAQYGIGINGNSFESSAITTFNGWQYTAYWVKNVNSYYVALARRQTGATTWQVANLTGSTLSNGLNGTKPSDAHNVVSFGIDQNDGTIHLAYDMHGHPLKYRVSQTGVATSPDSISSAQWTQSLFNAPVSTLSGTSLGNSVTYPHFFNRNNGSLQLTYRTGSSGSGSNWIADYSGTTHTWSNVHQFDDGFAGTYYGTVTQGDSNRNNYHNGMTYGPTGRLYQSFTWREGASGAANHDLNFVYSDDNGNTWKNNAGTTVGTNATKFTLNSPGLTVVPLSESMSLMNQQTQAVTSTDKFHTLMWHRDTARTNTGSSTVWDPNQSSYFDYWRDSLGNFHRNKLPGSVGQRPKLFFDANDNAIAVYQAGAISSGGIYINNGDLVIAAATKTSNWTDWKIVKTETGPFVSEAQADARNFALNGVLSVEMQESPGATSPAQGTNIRALDYTFALAPATDAILSKSGSWNTAGNWSIATAPSGNANAVIANGRTATLSTSAGTIDNSVVIGSATAGTFNLSAGGSLTVGGSVVVGRDGGAVGTYTQTGGTLSSWRFVVGDYYTETSGGGASSAAVSGGTLTTSELLIAQSANGSSNNSSFTVSGTGAVTVNGEVIVADFGSTGSLAINGGSMTVLGDIHEGFNGANTSSLVVNGGTLDVTNNAITLDSITLNGGTIANVPSFSTLNGTGGTVTRTDGASYTLTINNGNTGASIQNGNGVAGFTKLTNGSLTLSGSSTYTGATLVSAGTLTVSGQLANTSGVTIGAGGGAAVVQAQNTQALGTGTILFDPTGNASTARLEISGDASLNNPITLSGRNNASVAIENTGGNNALSGTIGLGTGGGNYWIQSDAGTLTLSNPIAITAIATGTRTITLQGAGDGAVSGAISNGAATLNLVKAGAGTWTLSGNNAYTGTTSVAGGTLKTLSAITNGKAVTIDTGVIDVPPKGDAGRVTSIGVLTTTNGGRIDLHDNDLIINYGNGTSEYANVVAKVKQGLVSLGGNGTGIGSSDVDSGTIPGTTLAVVDNQGLLASTSGFTIPAPLTSVIVKFTWIGDANLDGVVNGSDYALIDSGFAGGGSRWTQGDLNYDGVVNGSDYALIDTGFSAQSGALPEPTALSLLGMGAITLRRRRRSA